MKLQSIETQNFFNHKYSKLDFEKIGNPVLIQGENGAGKSSFMTEALTFALFGQMRLESVDDAIRNGATEMGVGIKFNLNGQNIEILRTKKRSKSAKLELIINGSHTEELLSETQTRLNNLIGLSYNSFLSSIILKQEDADFFVNQKSDERKKIIGEILDLTQYEVLEKLARERRTLVKNEIKADETIYNSIVIKDVGEFNKKQDLIDEALKKIEVKLVEDNKVLDDLMKSNAMLEEKIKHANQIKSWNQQTKNRLHILDTKKHEYSTKLTTLKTKLEKSKTLPNLEDLKGTILKLEQETQKDVLELENSTEIILHEEQQLNEVINNVLDTLRQEQKAKETPYYQADAQLLVLQKAIDHLKGLKSGECPTCCQEITDATRASILTARQEEYEKIKTDQIQLQIPIDENKERIRKIQSKEAPEIQTVINKINKLKEKNNAFKIQVNQKKESLKTLIAEYQNTLVLQNDRTNITLEIDLLTKLTTENAEEISTVEKELQPEIDMSGFKLVDTTSIQKTIQEFGVKKEMCASEKYKLENEINLNKQAIETKNGLEKTLKNKLHQVELLDKLCIAFSRKGIPSAIIATVLPEIEEIANKFLNKMSYGRLKITFRTSLTQKNGVEKDTLDIEVNDGQEWRKFESYSGGEKFRISLAIRLALSKVLSQRANIDLQLLILDEAATSLDQSGREEFMNVINSLRNDFEHLILMSHIPELANSIDNRILFTRGTDGTKIVSINT